MQRGEGPGERATDPQASTAQPESAAPLSDAAMEAAAGGLMIVNQKAFLDWLVTHDTHGNEIDPQTKQIVKPAGP